MYELRTIIRQYFDPWYNNSNQSISFVSKKKYEWRSLTHFYEKAKAIPNEFLSNMSQFPALFFDAIVGWGIFYTAFYNSFAFIYNHTWVHLFKKPKSRFYFFKEKSKQLNKTALINYAAISSLLVVAHYYFKLFDQIFLPGVEKWGTCPIEYDNLIFSKLYLALGMGGAIVVASRIILPKMRHLFKKIGSGAFLFFRDSSEVEKNLLVRSLFAFFCSALGVSVWVLLRKEVSSVKYLFQSFDYSYAFAIPIIILTMWDQKNPFSHFPHAGLKERICMARGEIEERGFIPSFTRSFFGVFVGVTFGVFASKLFPSTSLISFAHIVGPLATIFSTALFVRSFFHLQKFVSPKTELATYTLLGASLSLIPPTVIENIFSIGRWTGFLSGAMFAFFNTPKNWKELLEKEIQNLCGISSVNNKLKRTS